jgi:hypothetical protein
MKGNGTDDERSRGVASGESSRTEGTNVVRVPFGVRRARRSRPERKAELGHPGTALPGGRAEGIPLHPMRPESNPTPSTRILQSGVIAAKPSIAIRWLP